MLHQHIFIDRFGKCRPAAGTPVFVHGRKKRLAGHDIDIKPLLVLLSVRMGKCRLRAFFLRNVILLRRQGFPDFFV